MSETLQASAHLALPARIPRVGLGTQPCRVIILLTRPVTNRTLVFVVGVARRTLQDLESAAPMRPETMRRSGPSECHPSVIWVLPRLAGW